MANPDDKPPKLSFEEALNSLTIFFVDEQLEREVEDEISQLIKAGQELKQELKLQESHASTTEALSSLLQRRQDALQIVLREIGLSEEKFLRVVSVLRQQGIVAGKLDREWNLKQVTQRLQKDAEFAKTLASLFLEGHCDPKLRSVIPRYYLDMLNLREVTSNLETERRARYKAAMIGTYSSRKGYYVESRIQAVLQRINVSYGRGRPSFVNVNVDFAVPSLEDPWVIVMSSFQETTSSGQSTKARDMLNVYHSILRLNARNLEKRVFVNFVDGGGWLARISDFQRLVENCDYFINLQNLDMLEAIIRKHVPQRYLSHH